MSMRIKVLLVDDHSVVRDGLRVLLEAEGDIAVVGGAANGLEAVRKVRELHPDVVVMDLAMPELNGTEATAQIHDISPEVEVLVLSMHDETLFADRVLRAGARGYIMKREAITGLVGAIRRVLSGRIYVSDGMAQTLLERLGHEGAAPDNPLARLTDRELEVFDLIGRGLSTGEIAGQLGVSVKTIETYRSNIKTKLNLKDATDLIRLAATWTERL